MKLKHVVEQWCGSNFWLGTWYWKRLVLEIMRIVGAIFKQGKLRTLNWNV